MRLIVQSRSVFHMSAHTTVNNESNRTLPWTDGQLQVIWTKIWFLVVFKIRGQLWKTSLGKCLKFGNVVLNTSPKTDHRQLATEINVQLRGRVQVKVHILPFKWTNKTGEVVACKTACFELWHIKYHFRTS